MTSCNFSINNAWVCQSCLFVNMNLSLVCKECQVPREVSLSYRYGDGLESDLLLNQENAKDNYLRSSKVRKLCKFVAFFG